MLLHRIFAIRFFMACLLGALLLACGTVASTPEGTVKEYLKAVADNRAADAVAFYELGNVKDNDLTMVKGKLQMMIGAEYSRMQDDGGLQLVETRIVSQEGDAATVETTLTMGQGKQETNKVDLVKKEGRWMIQLNSLMDRWRLKQ
ncbi:MAG: DUF4878 domain-containing protein [Burkholderiaceae bacterium]|nr:DUF4878 domain-containing protein [Burkholderiaceae bacterium]